MDKRNVCRCAAQRILLGGLVVTLLPSLAHAISIWDDAGGNGYLPERHSRFYEGADRDFLGDQLGFDLTGVSRHKPPVIPEDDLPGGERNFSNKGWATLISETHFITSHNIPARDFDRNNDGIGDRERAGIVFYRDDSLSGETWEGFVEPGSYSFFADDEVRIGRVVGANGEAPPDWVKRYPLLKRPHSEHNFNPFPLDEVDPTIYVLGRGHNENGGNSPDSDSPVRLGRNTIRGPGTGGNTILYTLDVGRNEAQQDVAGTSGGDSSGPSFANLPVVGPALAGVHVGGGGNLDGGSDADLTHYIDGIRQVVESAGETINIVTDLIGDINGNFSVGPDDLAILAGNFPTATGAAYAEGDLDLNGSVGPEDLAILAGNFAKKIQLPAGFNEDKSVDGDDFFLIADAWRTSVAPESGGDITGDGNVNLDDVYAFDSFFLSLPSVPEPLVRILGDANLDGRVNLTDLAAIDGNLGNTGGQNLLGDANGDGVVGSEDVAAVAGNQGKVYADVSGDSFVDIDDVIALDQNWLKDTTNGLLDEDGNLIGDIDQSGVVNEVDLAEIGYWWGTRIFPEGSPGVGVPEPTAIALLTLAAAFGITRRQT